MSSTELMTGMLLVKQILASESVDITPSEGTVIK